MRRRCIILYVLLAMTMAQAQPKLQVIPLQDLGDRFAGSPQEAEFVLENLGSEVLDLRMGAVGCGCTVALLDTPRVPPGANGRIRLGYRPDTKHPRRGRQRFEVSLHTNDPLQRTVVLAVSMELFPLISAEPARLTLRSAEDTEFLLRVLRDAQDSAPELRSPVAWLQIELLEQLEGGDWTRYRYRVRVREGDVPVSPRAVLEWRTGVSEMPALEVPVTMEMERIEAHPGAVLWGTVASGQEQAAEVSLSFGKEDMPTALLSSSSALHAVLKPGPAPGSALISVVFSAPVLEQPRSFRESIRVLDAQDRLMLKIPLLVTVRP